MLAYNGFPFVHLYEISERKTINTTAQTQVFALQNHVSLGATPGNHVSSWSARLRVRDAGLISYERLGTNNEQLSAENTSSLKHSRNITRYPSRKPCL